MQSKLKNKSADDPTSLNSNLTTPNDDLSTKTHLLLNPQSERVEVARAEAAWLEALLPNQCMDGSVNDGAFAYEWPGWYDGRHAAYVLARLMAIRCWAGEVFCDIAPLDEAIHRATAFICRRQAPDGRLDLCGSYSPNEIGFAMPGLAEGYRRFSKLPGNPFAADLVNLKEFLLRGAEAVLHGSAYTANHRWTAACAPLAAVHSLWPDSRYLAKIEDYLADGIDCDEDGCWYEERSPIYNMVANLGLMIMADCLGRTELLDPVLRSMRLTLLSIQPNGEIDSSFSHRQDRGAPIHAISYPIARRCALITGDGRFTALALAAWERSASELKALAEDKSTATKSLGRQSGDSYLLFEIDRHPEQMPTPQALPDSYEKHIPRISVIRRRNKDTSLTLAADAGGHFYDTVLDQWGGPKRSDDWFHLFHHDIVIQTIHLAGAGMANIQPNTLHETPPGCYELQGFMPGWIHTLHFRPGRASLQIDWNWSHKIVVTPEAKEIGIRLDSNSDVSLIASFRFYIRPGVTVQEQGLPLRQIIAGETISLGGGRPLILKSASHSMEIHGLPPASHQAPIQHKQPIPSRIPRICGCLSLGLLFPVTLDFRIVLD